MSGLGNENASDGTIRFHTRRAAGRRAARPRARSDTQSSREGRSSAGAFAIRAAPAIPRDARRTILAFPGRMPRDAIQGLTFLLGLLLAFYFLMPFLELTTFR